MKTVGLDEIVRQKDPGLKRTVDQPARGEVGLAIAGLSLQGRIHEVGGPEERIAAIAQEYAKSRRTRGSFHPTTALAQRSTQAIQSELQAKDVASKKEDQTGALVPRQNLTGADGV